MLVEKRETRYRVQWYYKLFEQTMRGGLSRDHRSGVMPNAGEGTRTRTRTPPPLICPSLSHPPTAPAAPLSVTVLCSLLPPTAPNCLPSH